MKYIELPYSDFQPLSPEVDNVFDQSDFYFDWSKPKKNDQRDNLIRDLIAEGILQPNNFHYFVDY
jgi:hypothetical protein